MKCTGFLNLAVLAAAVGVGCAERAVSPGNGPADEDMTPVLADMDTVPPPQDDLAEQLSLCGDRDPTCQTWGLDPDDNQPFPLPTDANRDPAAGADGVGRNPSGYLVLDPTQASFHPFWLAQDSDGTVAKVDSRTMKEVARYRTTTCSSRPRGSKLPCDGQNGCCAADSQPQWANRQANEAEGPAQQVQLTDNSPSRTAVDFNGDVFVANRAFGGQASITKIANELSGCKDHNKNGRIDTSSDVNKDGRIDKNDPKEFLDLDDECILWTTNHGGTDATGRPLGLGPGAQDNGPSDAFAGEYNTGMVYRIDGFTGKTKDEWQLPQGCNPDGLAVDSQGFGWAPDRGPGELCYFDTRTSGAVGKARGSIDGDGISLDRDQNVWIGRGIARYTPDRSKGFASIGNGFWTTITGMNGIGIAADSRNLKKYFVWSASDNALTRIPASEIPLPKGMDTTVNVDPNWPKINTQGYGIGVDADQNVIAAPQSTVVTRTKVDQNGDFMPPDTSSPPKNGELCPAGDRCDLGSHQDTYSDFTGFGLRNFTRPAGTYSYVVRSGCADAGVGGQWFAVTWEADTPPNTTLTMHARSGPSAKPDQSWGSWTQDFKVAPADLSQEGTLVPNGPQDNGYYLQVEFTLKTTDRSATPKLKSFKVAYKCDYF